MIWIRKNEEVHISALMGLYGFPISFILYPFLFIGGAVEIYFFPAYIAVELFHSAVIMINQELPLWMSILAGVTGQYLCFFLIILLSFKLLRKMKITGEPGPARDKTTKDCQHISPEKLLPIPPYTSPPIFLTPHQITPSPFSYLFAFLSCENVARRSSPEGERADDY